MIWYSAPHIAGIRTTRMSRGALEALALIVLPPTLAAALRDEGFLS